ncbi:MAG: hypothetical protein ACI828_002265 [Flavobacteriales bacterium]|jgi:hypothetical protein
MIKVCNIGAMRYTPFGGFHEMDLPYLEAHGIRFVKDPKEADILVSQNRKHLKRYFLKHRNKKKYLIWTLEPRFDTYTQPLRQELFGFVRCHIMNLYTGDVFVSPLSFHAGLITKTLHPLPADFKLPNRNVVGLMSFYKGLATEKVMYHGKDVDLIKKRTAIGLYGHEQGVMHIFGKGWPAGVSKEDSREGDWVGRKGNVLDPYHFNLSFENTAVPRYTTEKIWDSIAGYCLPIYYGEGTEIYSLFPENSFIDYAKMEGPAQLFEYITEMSDAAYVARLNACIAVYNNISSLGKPFAEQQRGLALASIVQKLTKITESQ